MINEDDIVVAGEGFTNMWDLCEEKLKNFKQRFDEELSNFDKKEITLDNLVWARCYAADFVPEKPTFEDFAKAANIFAEQDVATARVLYKGLSDERRALFDRYLKFFWENLQ